MRFAVRILVVLAALMGGGAASAAETGCSGLTVSAAVGTIATGNARFDAGDTITISATGEARFAAGGGTIGGEHFSTLPYVYVVPETGLVSWRLPAEGRSGAVGMSCAATGIEALAGAWIVAATALSGVLLVTIVMAGRRRFVASGLIGMLTASAIAGLRPLPVLGTGWGVLDNRYVSILGLGVLCGVAACILFSLAIRLKAGVEVLNWQARAEEARGELMPSRWAIAAGRALPPRDIVRRWFVVVSAATGGMIASLGGLERFLHALQNAFAPEKIFLTLLSAVAAVVFLGPMHDKVLEAGAGHGEAGKGGGFGELLETLTPQRIARFIFAVLIAFLVVVCGECVTEAAKSSTIDAVVLIATAGLMPGVVTHFWAASLQYDAPSVEHQSTVPVVVAGLIFSLPAAAALAVALVASAENQQGAAIILGVPLFALLFAFVLGAVNFGVFAFVGGTILDRRKGAPGMFLLLAAAMVPLIVIVWVLLQAVASLILVGSIIPSLDARQLLQQALVGVGWVAGLWLSGFPRLMQRRGAAGALPAGSGADAHG